MHFFEWYKNHMHHRKRACARKGKEVHTSCRREESSAYVAGGCPWIARDGATKSRNSEVEAVVPKGGLGEGGVEGSAAELLEGPMAEDEPFDPGPPTR